MKDQGFPVASCTLPELSLSGTCTFKHKALITVIHFIVTVYKVQWNCTYTVGCLLEAIKGYIH